VNCWDFAFNSNANSNSNAEPTGLGMWPPMIGVLAQDEEQPVVREFFELFKTPWEFARAGSKMDVVICSRVEIPQTTSKLVLIFGSEANSFDRANKIQVRPQDLKKNLSYHGQRLPIYGNCAAFRKSAGATLTVEDSEESALLESTVGGQTFIRIGYDLFQEIRWLLTNGQPVIHAHIPALEMHIALLRGLIVGHSIPLVEIPPVPEGHNFIACLTHDVDHVGIRNHKFDHTVFGFLYRATIGTAIDFFKGGKTLKQVGVNWKAALSLPFVHLGIAEDFWYQFDRYVEIEKGLPSTFFVIPKKGDPGLDAGGQRPAKRAASYDVDELAEILKKLEATGHEIGVHGIEAWRDGAKGREELERISRLTGAVEPGVRMHWLFFDELSPAFLESAGFSYDSTVGYNETIGYRAGTTQAFKLLQTARLLELPMHVMDTALFYPSYLNLSSKEAEEMIFPLLENTVRFGGVLTVNWHDRSLAPERLWDGFYIWLLTKLKAKDAWFATAAKTVSWFWKRRSATFEQTEKGRIKIHGGGNDGLPGLRVRIFSPEKNGTKFVEMPLRDGMKICPAGEVNFFPI
jgi:peptidoglycan/xylan/chitin deacetylase (PgdA/CDA1 family)